MTILANVRRIDMAGVFSLNIDIVVATEAVPADVGMVEDSRDPKRAVVAIVALVS